MTLTFISAVFSSFLTLFVILDPFVSMVIFTGIMKNEKRHDINKAALTSASVAFGLLVLFLLIGNPLFDVLGIDFGSFKIAGGIILLILGIQQVLGLEFKTEHKSMQNAAVVIGTPLLAGPGALSSILILQKEYGILIPLIATILVCALTYIILACSRRIYKLIGAQMIEISSRILGLLLAAIAVSFIRDGILAMIIGK